MTTRTEQATEAGSGFSPLASFDQIREDPDAVTGVGTLPPMPVADVIDLTGKSDPTTRGVSKAEEVTRVGDVRPSSVEPAEEPEQVPKRAVEKRKTPKPGKVADADTAMPLVRRTFYLSAEGFKAFDVLKRENTNLSNGELVMLALRVGYGSLSSQAEEAATELASVPDSPFPTPKRRRVRRSVEGGRHLQTTLRSDEYASIANVADALDMGASEMVDRALCGSHDKSGGQP